MSFVDQLRLVASAAHALPGAELRLRSPQGEETLVSRHPAADLTPCAFRHLVVEAWRSHCPGSTFPPLRVVDVVVGGGLEDLGGGVLACRTPCGREQRWIGTTLPWGRVQAVLEGMGGDHTSRAHVEATVAPDVQLDVTLVGLFATRPGGGQVLDDVALDVAAALFVEELTDSLGSVDSGRRDAGA